MAETTGLPPVSAPLPWQGEAWLSLNSLLLEEQLPHAILLSGGRYTGKEQFALALARLLLCQQPADGLNCGQCHACELSASGSHGDLRWLAPEEKSRVIKIDQVRNAVDFINKTANFGRRKVVVLTPADSMNANAANALLKSLEEPASDTYLILVCHRLHRVPATIRSRCRLYRMPAPGQEDALLWLDQITGDRVRSAQHLAIAEGRPLLAEGLYRNDEGEKLAALRKGLQVLMNGQSLPSEFTSLLAGLEIEDLLSRVAAEIITLVRDMDQRQLGSTRGRAAFLLLDDVAALQGSVANGSNPNKQLLVDALMARLQRDLGRGSASDNMSA